MKKNFTILYILLTIGITKAQTAYIPCSGLSNFVNVINVATNTVTDSIMVGVGPQGITISPDGTKVYVGNTSDNTVSVINTSTNIVSATIPVGSHPQALCITPDGSKVYVSNWWGSSLSVINTTSDSVVATIPVGSNPLGIAVSPDGTKVYVANSVYNGTITVINTAADTVSAIFAFGIHPCGISFNLDGTKVYITDGWNNLIAVISTSTNTVLNSIPVGVGPFSLCLSPNGAYLYVINQPDNSVSVINTSTNTVTATIPIGANPQGISVSPDGSKVYTANYDDDNVSVINTSTNTVSAVISVGNNPYAYGNFISSNNTSCSANFILYPDSTIQHLYWAIGDADGVPPLHYLWSWGDSTYDTIPYPSHTYSDSGIYTICLTVTDSTGCISTFCDSSYHIMRTSNYMVTVNVISDIMTGTKTIDSKNIICIYPNPANSTITLHSQLPILNSQLIITDVMGREIYHQPINNSHNQTIDVSQWSNGVYFYQLNSTGSLTVARGKFVKD